VKRIAHLTAAFLILFFFFIPGWGRIFPLIWWATVTVAVAAIGTTTSFFVLRWLKRRFPEDDHTAQI
jgi:hypothetical protein